MSGGQSQEQVHPVVGQLLPCPFCGCEAKYKTYGQDGKWAFHQVNCTSCDATHMNYQKSPDAVVGLWNASDVLLTLVQSATNEGKGARS